MNDIISDSITRIRNAYMRRKDKTTLLYSKTIDRSLAILKDHQYIHDFTLEDKASKKFFTVVLKYNDGKPAITEVKRVSKPGRRVYKPSSQLRSFKSGYGTFVISSNKGIVSNNQAKELNVGGELLFSVW